RGRSPDAEIGSRCAQSRARDRRARRSAGQGGAGTIPRRRDCRRARQQGRGAGAYALRAGYSVARRQRLRRQLGTRRRRVAESESNMALGDLMGMMKQASQLQAKMQEMQAELDRIEVDGTAGGGMVTVTLTAKGELKAVKLDDSLIKPDEKEILE